MYQEVTYVQGLTSLKLTGTLYEKFLSFLRRFKFDFANDKHENLDFLTVEVAIFNKFSK